MRFKTKNVPIFRCAVCGAEQAILGKGKDWTPIGGGLFVCQKQVCKDELVKRPMLGHPVPPELTPTHS